MNNINNKGLGFNLITGGILCVAIPLLIVGTISSMKSRSALENLGRAKLLDRAEDLASRTNALILEEIMLANVIASDPDILSVAARVTNEGANNAQSDIHKLYKRMVDIFKHLGDKYQGIFVSGADGILFTGILESGKEYKGSNISKRLYFQKAREMRKTQLSDIVKSKSTGKLILVTCVPLFSYDNKFVGAFGMALKASYLTDIISHIKIGKTGYPYITDIQGKVLAHPKNEYVFKLNIKDQKDLNHFTNAVFKNLTGVNSYEFEGNHKTAAYATIESKNWKLITTQQTGDLLSSVRTTNIFIMIVSGIAVLITIVVVWLLSHSIARPIQQLSEDMYSASEEVALASDEVSIASNTIEKSAKKQASTIQDISISLDKMSSITQGNASNAQQASELMRSSNDLVNKTAQEMNELITSMSEISKASEETQKIIKTIDGIAFQTNLLALNAAVESARAGEVGAGFAVVAEEVRMLAIRAAEAAQSTSLLIEDTANRVQKGVLLVDNADKAFQELSGSTEKVTDFVLKISNASSEQTQMVKQINQAVFEMDEIVKNNVKTSASTSEKMNFQAEQMKQVVEKLSSMVSGASN
jgi:methyl-accepting chemotaxis protein